MKLLPNEIIAIIFQYLQCPLAKIIKDEINSYENDYKTSERNYNSYFIRIHNIYYVKNSYSFSHYYFDKLKEPYDYKSYQLKLYEKLIKYCKYTKNKNIIYNGDFLHNLTKLNRLFPK
jgi:hypothetical protein